MVLACAGPLAMAAPVTGGPDLAVPPDPAELAVRWTLASTDVLVEDAAPPVAGVVATPRAGPAGGRVMPSAVPEPLVYALFGLALLGAGLWARRGAGAQRGFSKKT